GSATGRFTTGGRRSVPTMRGGATDTSLSLWSICMNSFLSMLLGWIGLAPPRIFCRRKGWDTGVRELARRTLGGKRESGAYLLGKTLDNGSHEILDFVFYDDVDPDALANRNATLPAAAPPPPWENRPG